MNLSNKWIWDHVNYKKKSGMRPQYRIFNCWVQICNQIRSNSSNTRVIIFKVIRPESHDFHWKTYIWSPYWIRHLKIWIYNRLQRTDITVSVLCRLQWSQKSPSHSSQGNRSKKIYWILSMGPPYWIRYFLFLKSDLRIVITNRRNSRVRVFKSITAKESIIYWNIVCEIAILDLLFRILWFWL